MSTLESQDYRNNQLITGALAITSGRNLGLTDDETLGVLSSTSSRQQAQADEAARLAGDPNDIINLANKYANNRAYLGGEIGDYPDPFGEAPIDVQVGQDRDRRRPQDDDQAYNKAEKIRYDVPYGDYLEPEIRVEPKFGGKKTYVQPGDAELIKGDQQRVPARRAGDTFYREERKRMKAEAAKLVAADRARLEGDTARQGKVREVRRANQYKAEAEANRIAEERFQRGGVGAQADMNIERIAEIGNLGRAKDVGHVLINPKDDPANFPTAVAVVDGRDPKKPVLGYLDPGNVPSQRGLIDPKLFIDAQNTADTSQMVNAPLPRAQQWMVDNLPAYKGGNGGGDPYYPQVDVLGEGRAFIDRVRNIDGFPADNVPSDIRNVGEFENVIDQVIAERKARGGKFFAVDKEKGVNRAVSNPGIDEVLNLLRMGDADRGRLANAMMQLEGGRINGVNADARAAFEARQPADNANVMFNIGRMREDGGNAYAIVRNEKVGRGKNRQNVQAGLRAIGGEGIVKAMADRGELFTQLPDGRKILLPNAVAAIRGAEAGRADARMPIIGAVAEDGPATNRFVRGDAMKLSDDALRQKYGTTNAEIAINVRNRENADRLRREAKLGGSPSDPKGQTDPYAAEQRVLDSRFRAEGRRVERDKEDREIGELVRLMQYGAGPVGFDLGEAIDGVPRVIEAAPAGRKLVVPSDSKFMSLPTNRVQQIQPSQVPMSIAPTPGDVTGNQPMPANDAGRGGWMGGGNGGRIVDPWASTAPEPKRGGPMPQSMRDELNAINNPAIAELEERVQGPDLDRERRMEVIKRIKGDNSRRRRNYGSAAAAAGATAGLAALISGEREEREEEAYQ